MAYEFHFHMNNDIDDDDDEFRSLGLFSILLLKEEASLASI